MFYTFLILGTVNIIYNVLCYKKKCITHSIRNNNLIIKSNFYITNQNYFNLQLKFGIAESILFFLFGFLYLFSISTKIKVIYLALIIPISLILNISLKKISLTKEYLKLNVK